MPPRIDFKSEAFLRDPATGVAALRAAGAVVETHFPIVGRVWVTTTYEAAARVLKDSATFSLRKEGGDVAGLRWWMPKLVQTLASNMLTTDEPDHTRLRGIVDEAFRRRAVVAMEPRIRAIADQLASELFAEGSPADLVACYAQILPLAVISELLGLPESDRPMFIGWANAMSRVNSAIGFLSVVPSFKKMRRYMDERLRAVRTHGGEGLIAELVKVEMEGARISHDEMLAMLFLLLNAGSITTTHLIGGAVFELLKDPARRDWLMADWSRASLAVEEFLRFVAPVQFSKPRHVRADVDIDGVRLRKGEQVMAMIVAANLDAEVSPHPEKLDLARKPNRHLSFGTGIHFCLGHQLARIETMAALEALFTRWPKLALAVSPAQIRYLRRPGLRSIARLPVRASA
jgi:cytochrome P450 PksS